MRNGNPGRQLIVADGEPVVPTLARGDEAQIELVRVELCDQLCAVPTAQLHLNAAVARVEIRYDARERRIKRAVCRADGNRANIQPAQESAPAMLVALESGRTDLVVTDMPTAMAACAAYPDMKLLDFSGTEDDFSVSDEEVNIGISVQKGNTELLDGINSVLETMTVDDFNSLMQEAISVQPLAE